MTKIQTQSPAFPPLPQGARPPTSPRGPSSGIPDLQLFREEEREEAQLELSSDSGPVGLHLFCTREFFCTATWLPLPPSPRWVHGLKWFQEPSFLFLEERGLVFWVNKLCPTSHGNMGLEEQK